MKILALELGKFNTMCCFFMRKLGSRKGYWHLSKTIASGVGLTNAWLADQGLLSMKTLWAKLAPLRGTA